MKKGFVRGLSTIALFSLGLSLLTSCSDGSLELKASSTTLYAGLEYTVTAELNDVKDENEGGTFTFTFDSATNFDYSVSDNVVTFTATNTGSYKVSASYVKGDYKLESTLNLNILEPTKTYTLGVDTTNMKTSYKQGELFSTTGLNVYKTLYLNGTETTTKTTLDESSYTLSITNNTLLTELGTKEVTVTPTDTSLGTAKFNIEVLESTAYLIDELLLNLGYNYTAGELYNGHVYPYYLINDNYIVNYNSRVGLVYNVNGGVTSNGTSKKVVFTSTFDCDEDGYIEEDTLEVLNPIYHTDGFFAKYDIDYYSTSIEDALDYYQLESGYNYNSEWLEEGKEVTSGDSSYIEFEATSTMLDYIIDLCGMHSLYNGSYTANGLYLSLSSIFEENDCIVASIPTTDRYGNTGTVNFIIYDIGDSSEAAYEELITNDIADIANQTEDPILNSAINTVRESNFTAAWDLSSTYYNYTYIWEINANPNATNMNVAYTKGDTSWEQNFGVFDLTDNTGYSLEAGYYLYQSDSSSLTEATLYGPNTTYWHYYAPTNWYGFTLGTDDWAYIDWKNFWNIYTYEQDEEGGYYVYMLDGENVTDMFVFQSSFSLLTYNALMDEDKNYIYTPKDIKLYLYTEIDSTTKEEVITSMYIGFDVEGTGKYDTNGRVLFTTLDFDMEKVGTTQNPYAQEVLSKYLEPVVTD